MNVYKCFPLVDLLWVKFFDWLTFSLKSSSIILRYGVKGSGGGVSRNYSILKTGHKLDYQWQFQMQHALTYEVQILTLTLTLSILWIHWQNKTDKKQKFTNLSLSLSLPLLSLSLSLSPNRHGLLNLYLSRSLLKKTKALNKHLKSRDGAVLIERHTIDCDVRFSGNLHVYTG